MKYHVGQFVEMFRDALMRPGHELESYERAWCGLERVKIMLKGKLDGKEEMKAFEDVKEEFERIGQGRPSFHIVLGADETGES